jgi:predicted O-linked N-acetylglucosamine transferase (SPINDLY family)
MADHPAIAAARKLLSEGAAAKAIETLRFALRRSPQDPELNYNSAGVLLQAGRPAEAEFFAERAVTLLPSRGLYHGLLGEVYAHLAKFPQAEKCFVKAIALDPKLYSSRQNLANIRLMAFDYEDAERLLREAWALRPELVEAPVNLANILVETARAAEARRIAEACADQHAYHPFVIACLANLLNYTHGVRREEVTAVHARFGELMTQAVPPLPPPPNAKDPGRKLRVGFISADFKQHSVAYFIEPVLRHLPRDRVQVVGLSRVFKADWMTPVLKSLCDEWIDLNLDTDREVGLRIREARIDVAIELSGLTQGNSLGAMTLRPAPVQFSYLGYPNTTGIPAISGRLVDSITDPVSEPPLVPGETSYRIDPIFLCYRSASQIRGEPWPDEAPPREPGPLTFASFNVISKFNDAVADAWAKLLLAVPEAKLILKARSLGGASVRQRILGAFSARNVDPARIELLAHIPSQEEHLALYRRVDVAIDPFPYVGTTTTCEALTMGVPVVTLHGSAHAGRVGASILSCVGLRDCIARSTDEYVRIASTLIRDRERLTRLRRTLRADFARSPLGDGPAMGERMERAIRAAWTAWCRTTS